MFYLLIVFVVWCGTQRHAFAQDTSSTQLFNMPNSGNWTAFTDELSKKPVVAMTGNNNYNVAQQIFYICNEEQLKKILMNNKHSEKMGGTGVTAHKLVNRWDHDWNSARKFCSDDGGHLAIINSDAEEQVLINLMKESNITIAWLGAHDLYKEGEWVTIDGESIREAGYAKWTTKYPNQPDNHGDANCAMLVVEGGMDDAVCSTKAAFFCEMDV